MEKRDDAEPVQTSCRAEPGGSEGLRQRNRANPQVIGCSLSVDALDIRLPKQEKPFTRKDVDSFTLASRIRTLKVLSAVVSAILLVDTIHKCVVYRYLYVDWKNFFDGVGIQIIISLFLIGSSIFLQKLGHRLTLKHTECFSMLAYVLSLAVYLFLTVGWSSTLQAHNEDRVIDISKCIAHDQDHDVLLLKEKFETCYYKWSQQTYNYSSNMHFHEMMTFAVSCFLLVLMPLNATFVFVCQIIQTWTLLKYWPYWALLKPEMESHLGQMLVLALMPRMLLSLGCAGFAMHQQRYLSIVCKDYALSTKEVSTDYYNQTRSSDNGFAGIENSGQNSRYHEMENPSQGPSNVAQDFVMEDFASGALNLAQSMSPSNELDMREGTCNSEVISARQLVPSPAWQAVPESTQNRKGVKPQRPSGSSGSEHLVSFTMSSDSSGSDELMERVTESDKPDSSDTDSERVKVILANEFVGKGEVAKHDGSVSLSEFAKIPRHPVTGKLTSIGSANHFQGSCHPCEWLQRSRFCKFGWRCPYCHITEEHVYSAVSRRRRNEPKKDLRRL